MLKYCLGRVLLEVLRVGDDLDDTIPHLIPDMITGSTDKCQDGVDIPFVRARVLFGQDSDLQHHLLTKSVIRNPEIPQQLADDELRVVHVAHTVEEVESTPANGDIFISQRQDYSSLVFLDGRKRLRASCEVCHSIKTQVAYVCLFRGDKLSKEDCRRGDERRIGIEVYCEADGFEEDRVLSIIVLNVARRF